MILHMYYTKKKVSSRECQTYSSYAANMTINLCEISGLNYYVRMVTNDSIETGGN